MNWGILTAKSLLLTSTLYPKDHTIMMQSNNKKDKFLFQLPA